MISELHESLFRDPQILHDCLCLREIRPHQDIRSAWSSSPLAPLSSRGFPHLFGGVGSCDSSSRSSLTCSSGLGLSPLCTAYHPLTPYRCQAVPSIQQPGRTHLSFKRGGRLRGGRSPVAGVSSCLFPLPAYTNIQKITPMGYVTNHDSNFPALPC